MDEISRLYAKKPIVKRSNSSLRIQRKKSSQQLKSPADRILFLQRTIGNQAVQRLIKSGALQLKLRIGQPGDVYEQEADRVADEVMRMPEPGVQRQVGPEEEEEEILQTKPLVDQITPLVQRQVEEEEEEEMLQAKSREDATSEVPNDLESQINTIRGGGRPLSRSERGFFESRFETDFSNVRLHDDTNAASVAQSINSRAFTLGCDVVFGPREYSPSSASGRRLLAHELTHVAQQNGEDNVGLKRALTSFTQIQRSTLSDSVRAAHVADSSLEVLLARLAQSDIQSAQTDTDVDAELVRILSGRTDDLWVAQQIRQGRLIENSRSFGPQTMPTNPIQVHFFRGTTNQRALVIAGVHGTEVQGIEVAQHLITDLQAGMAATPPRLPAFSVIIVPSLFPDNAAAGIRQGATPTNRNFPDPRHTLATAPRNAAGRPLDSRGAATATRSARPSLNRPILTQNILLMALMERFSPERIISIHGTWRAGAGGVFYDPRQLTPAEYHAARQYAVGMAYMSVLPEYHDTPEGQQNLREFERRFFYTRINEISQRATQTDENLSLATARAIETSTSSITGRERRQFANREGEPQPVPSAQVAARRLHPSVAGNVGASGNLDTAYWSGNSPPGYSLGGYASARGMSIFTVEPPLNCTTADYAPRGRCAGRVSAVSAAERRTELMSYAEAIRTVLLGSGASTP